MHDPLIGRQLDCYEIRASLGAGGMARVYKAFDQNLKREVAVKVLYDPMHRQADFADRFVREARTLATLNHPSIVHIYNIGQHDGMSYIVQELLPGPTLEDELAALHEQGRYMDAAEVQRVVAQLASALDYAHARGIVHRDLKPGNVLRNHRGEAVLVDFGIAKATAGAEKLTQTGMVMGTPAYLAPEQALGSQELTPAVDIYALGIMLYEMLSGRVPFGDTSPLAVALAHVNQPPPPLHTLRSDIPDPVEDVVMRALAKKPEYRFKTAGELSAALNAAWGGTPGQYVQTPGSAALAASQAPPSSGANVHQAQTTINPSVPPRGQNAPLHSAQTTVNPAAGTAAHSQAQGVPLHSAQTTVNPALAARRPAAPPADQQPARAQQGAAPAPAAASRTRWVVAGGLLLLLLLGFLLTRGGDETGTTAAGGNSVETTQAAPTEPAQSDEQAAVPTQQAVPTDSPAPTQAPSQPAAPPPSTPGETIARASLVLDQAASSGQADPKTAEDLQKKLGELEEKLSEDKGKDAGKKVQELQKKINEEANKGKLSPDVAAELNTLLGSMNL